MSLFQSVSLAEIKTRGSIKDADVAKLRKNFAEDPLVTVADAETLMSLNDACPIQDPAWCDCFVDLMTDFAVEQTEPQGYLNAEKSGLLRAWIAREGRIEAKAKLDLLINVIARSRWTPQSLVVFALDQVRMAIVDGTGPLRAGRFFEPRTVTEGDVVVIRRILQAFGTEGSEGITRAEAEMLMAIDLATSASQNHDAWRDLFVAAIGSTMFAASGYGGPSRQDVFAAHAWPSGDADLDNILSGMVGSEPSIIRSYRPLSREERAVLRLTQQKVAIVTREDVAPYEASWLAEHLNVLTHRTANMMALLRLLKREGRPLDTRLQALLDQTPAAAA